MAPSATYGADVRRRRNELGWSLGATARAAHLDKSYLSAIERGTRRGSVSVAEALDRALEARGALVALYHRSGQVRRAVSAQAPAPIPWARCRQGCRRCEVLMTQLAAITESVRLALAVGGVGAAEAVEEAVGTFAADYSSHAPAVLLPAVADTRTAIGDALAGPLADPVAVRLKDAAGWASAMLGNLAEHLGRPGDARTHLTTAYVLAEDIGDARLACYVRGLQAMLAREAGDLDAALVFAEGAVGHARGSSERAKAAAWARARTLGEMGDASGADAALNDARAAFDGDVPGRFGFDEAELWLHQGEVALALGRTRDAQAAARTSAALVATTRPAWVAARLVETRALAAEGDVAGAEAVAADVLERHAPERLRATSRRRLGMLVAETGGRLPDLAERVAALPPLAV